MVNGNEIEDKHAREYQQEHKICLHLNKLGKKQEFTKNRNIWNILREMRGIGRCGQNVCGE